MKELLAFAVMHVLHVGCKCAVGAPPPQLDAPSAQQQVLRVLGTPRVHPSGLPFRNTLKSSCLSSHSHSFVFHLSSLHLIFILSRGPKLPVKTSYSTVAH